jgi:hypothetical protein
MTDLSPAAQAIEDAYFNADGFGYRNALAAALRAAVKHCAYPDDYGDEFINPSDLLAIAAELDT